MLWLFAVLLGLVVVAAAFAIVRGAGRDRSVWGPPATALALVVPSVVAAGGDAEGLPSVVPEAMARGCAVVGTNEGGIAEAITDGLTGLLTPPGDAASLAAAMHRLVSEPDLAPRLAGAAFAAASEHLNAWRQSSALEAILLAAAAQESP